MNNEGCGRKMRGRLITMTALYVVTLIVFGVIVMWGGVFR